MPPTHGRTNTTEYRTWRGMLTRCFNEKDPTYRYYGSRGITVCVRWRSFEAFFQDMGPRPSSEHSLDRIDNMRGYSCGACDDCVASGNGTNCRWATRKVQNRNTRRNVWVEAGGKRVLATDRATELGISRQAMSQRLASGWSQEAAATQPRPERKLFGGKSLSELARSAGFPYTTLAQRVASGWSEEELLLPVGAKRAQRSVKPRRPNRCRACGNTGHNAATCRQLPVPAET